MLLLFVASCAGPQPVKVVKGAPPMPKIEPHPEPILAAIPSELPPVNLNDPIDLAILSAQVRFEKGEDYYKQGFLKRAKDEFNAAIDVVLATAASYPKEP